MRLHNVPGICGIDVRQLVKRIREHGTMKAKLIFEGDDDSQMPFVDINKENLVAAVSRKDKAKFGVNGKWKVLAVDCGLKYNQVRCMVERGCEVEVVPYDAKIDEMINDYDGLFLSNGPGELILKD
jgi:carbamoyl-phosphate synthase/aspartate carbamoyltransferase/dihydroorotase